MGDVASRSTNEWFEEALADRSASWRKTVKHEKQERKITDDDPLHNARNLLAFA